MNSKIPCSVEILTRNSALTLERCLESVKDFAEIIVLDGNSTDGTLEIARRYGCEIYKQYETDEPNVAIKDYSEVRNKGLRIATYDWFMYIDSDEYLSREAAEEIRSIVGSVNPPVHVFWQPRKYVLEGKIVDCTTTYPNRQIRLFHRQYADGFIKPIHERIKMRPGAKIGWLKGIEYLPVDSLAMLDARWRRYIGKELEMYKNAPYKKVIKIAARQGGLFLLYFMRYLKNLFFCRGQRMPFLYEWARHKYLLIFAGRLLAGLI